MSASPVIGSSSTRTPSSRPTSQKSSRSARSSRSGPSSKTTEETPLLSRDSRYPSEDDQHDSDAERPRSLAESSLLRSLHFPQSSSRKRRWPSIIALLGLCIAVVLIMFLRFFVPEAVTEYAKQAAEFHPTNVSLDSMTENGIRIRVAGDVMLDASKVRKNSVRGIGRFATWLAKEVESGPAEVNIYLPEYGNEIACTAKVPSIKVDVRNRHTTHLDFLTEVQPQSFEAIRNLANDWLDGRMSQIHLRGEATVALKSGIINVGKQTIIHDLPVDSSLLPKLPSKNLAISKLNIHAGDEKGVLADATVTVPNDSVFGITLPSIGFDVLVDGCTSVDPFIKVANGSSGVIDVRPKSDIVLAASAYVESIPEDLTRKCEETKKSPFDALTYDFTHGLGVPVHVKCCSFPDPSAPKWASDLLKDFATIPVPFPGKSLDHLLKNFSLANTEFSLPEPAATPGTPEAQPKISATIKALIALPEEMNFPLNVSRVRADALIYYNKKKLGKLDLSHWQQANSSKLAAHNGEGPMLLVESMVKKAPLEILDEMVFSEVVQKLIFGHGSVLLAVKADVDVEIDTPVGMLVVKQLPAEGVVPIKPISSGGGGDGHGFESLKPAVHDLQIVDTTPDSLTIQAQVNFTNPTKYSATVPYISINILTNDTVLGHAIAENISVVPGRNTNIKVRAIWEPRPLSGDPGKAVGRELISQYLSGYNTTLTFRTHNGTIPAQPSFGAALSRFSITLPTPRLRMPSDPSSPPDNGDDGDPDDSSDPTAPHFIQSTTLHIFSSTAVFSLISPLNKSTIFIEHINATAWYHEDPVGKILHDLPFAVPPGKSETPRLPVEWSLGSVGYEAVRKALGGTLHVNATAQVGVRLGQWRERLWFRGRGIGAHVRV